MTCLGEIRAIMGCFPGRRRKDFNTTSTWNDASLNAPEEASYV